jgi:hypothetical protein
MARWRSRNPTGCPTGIAAAASTVGAATRAMPTTVTLSNTIGAGPSVRSWA